MRRGGGDGRHGGGGWVALNRRQGEQPVACGVARRTSALARSWLRCIHRLRHTLLDARPRERQRSHPATRIPRKRARKLCV